MRNILLLVGCLLFTIASPIQLHAQETDPYADYSYLWENSKTKKKKKGKPDANAPAVETTNQTPTEQPKTEPPKSASTLKIVYDSIPDEQPKVNTDSIRPQDQPIPEIPADTIRPEEKPRVDPQPAEEQPKPEVKPEPTPEPTTDPVDQAAEDLAEEKPEKVKKEKKERPADDGPLVEDFRAGMGALGAESSSFNGGFTFTQIGGDYFVGLTLNPELRIWKIGLGLNIPILFNINDYSFRSDIFKDGVGAARLINYIRYGIQKRDPVYVKVGELNNMMLGYGGLINNYTNSTSFEKRKVGLHYDVNYKGLAGIEGMYSDFDPLSTNLFAIRPYARPLAITGIPIIKTFEIGMPVISDKDQTRIITSDSTFTTYNYTRNGVNAFGFDAGLTLLRIPFIQIDAFSTFNRLNIAKGGLNDTLVARGDAPIRNGNGFSYGVNFRFHFIADLLSTDVRIERLNYSNNFIPQFFDASYELNKDARIMSLQTANAQQGIYGSLTGHVLKKMILGGSLLIPDQIGPSSPAVVQVNAVVDRLMDKYSLQASYFKGNLTDLNDAFSLDERSIAKVRMIYHLNKFMATGLDYFWAFTPTGDGGFKATRYVSPYFGLSIQF